MMRTTNATGGCSPLLATEQSRVEEIQLYLSGKEGIAPVGTHHPHIELTHDRSTLFKSVTPRCAGRALVLIETQRRFA